MRQKICPVCGHLEEAFTEYCTECGAKTIDYDDGTGEPRKAAKKSSGQKEREARTENTQDAQEGGSAVSGGGASSQKGAPLGLIGVGALMVIGGLFLANKYILGDRDVPAMGSSPAVSDGDSQSQAGESGQTGGAPEDSSAAPEEERPAGDVSEPEQTPEPTSEPTPEPGSFVEEGVNTYELIVADVTWTEAYYDCLNRGGHLVRITSDEEYQAILQQIESEGKKNILFWLGGARNDDSGYYWIYDEGRFGVEVLNEDEKYASYWLDGEPSFHDDTANADETRMNMFRLSSSGRWVWNDVPDDILSVASFYSGKIGYICEYE